MKREINSSQVVDQLVRTWSIQKKREERERGEGEKENKLTLIVSSIGTDIFTWY